MLTPEAIPEALRRTPQWIVYRLQRGKDKTDKLPVDHRTGHVHDAHDEAIWMTFERAGEVMHLYDGLGFVFTATDPFTGIDLDKCMTEDGTLEPWAEQIVDCFQSYAETSISGTGVHIIIRGKLPASYGHKVNGQGPAGTGAVEVYSERRFFTFTGKKLEGSPGEALDRQEEFEAFCRARLPRKEQAESSPPAPNHLPDEDVLLMARKVWPVDRFRELFDEGDLTGYSGDWNRADMALVNFLSFWTGKHAEQIDRLFRTSALMREKWDEKRGSTTYGRYTVDKVISTAAASYNAAEEPEEDEGDPGATGPKSQWDPPLLDDTIPAEPFPIYVFPAELADFLQIAASCLTCPVDFLAVTALVTAGTAIGRSFAVKVKETWIETASLYAALVARPGATKSPALALIARPLWAITEDLLAEYRRELQLVEKNDPKPILRRIAVSDTTCEALAPILSENPRGVALVRDELTAWVTGMNQYKTGGKGADRQFFLSAWASAAVTVDRKGQHERGPLHIPHPFLSVVGALTPDMISELAEEKTRDDGFIDRLLFTMPDPVRVRWNDSAIPPELSEAWLTAVRQLFTHPMIPDNKPRPFFARFTPDAKTLYSAWYDGHCAEAEGEDFPRHLEGFWAKMRAYTARLALILDRLSRAYNPIDEDCQNISAASVHGAITLAHYFKTHCRRVRGLIGSDNPDARAVIKWIRKTNRTVFSTRDVKQNFRSRFVHAPEGMEDCLRWLEARSCIRHIETPAKVGPGRTRSAAFEVNPYLLRGAEMEL